MKKNKFRPLFDFLASAKLTVVCLSLLLVVVIWGTVYQVDHGLYASQQKFFNSWTVLLFGFIPFPGTVLLFWILSINLLSSLFFRIPLKWSNTGNILTHVGILIFFAGSFFTAYFSQESMIRLQEGEEKNYSASDRDWELAVWKGGVGRRVVYAVDTDRLVSGDRIFIDSLNFQILVLEYHKNAIPLTGSSGNIGSDTLNISGIQALRPASPHREPGNNRAGLIFSIETPEKIPQKIVLYAGDREPTRVMVGKSSFFCRLRNKRFLLPFTLGLIDFRKSEYPGSTIVKSYESRVKMKVGELSREVIISMNKPLRYKNYTLYQSSYFIARDGTEFSFLAVVENFGKIFPYIASTIIFLGLCIHFLLMLMRKKKKAKS